MMQKDKLLFALLLLFFLSIRFTIYSQGPGGCPENIGFELGTFKNWECFAGTIDKNTGLITLNLTPPVSNRHDVIKNTYPQLLDPFGKFPINCPNGSGFSAKLGNSSTQQEAERLSYTFTIPVDQNNYSIIYNYAVVLENPNHQDFQQPKFTSKVFDVTSGQYVQCGSFEFVASGTLPGFKLSDVKANVFYKPWSPITVNLYGYAGKTIRLEFTTNDCALGGHFGYAYLDVNENCSSPIAGNIYCNGASSLTLTAPFGFKDYHWFNSDYSQVLGNSNILNVSPPPPANTTYQLEIIPFPGLGCLDTLTSTVKLSPEAFNLNVLDTVFGCSSAGVDLTDSSVTKGSAPKLTFSYFSDINETQYVPTPKVVTQSGVYYIKAFNATGCNDKKAVTVIIKNPPNVVTTNPAAACAPNTVDITLAIAAASDAGLKYSYWKDKNATVQVPNAKAVDSAGTYYIKGSDLAGCSKIVPVVATIGSVPKVVVTNIANCGKVDISTSSVTQGSDGGLTYSYWQDSAASVILSSPTAITSSGKYYIKGVTNLGCSSVKPVVATVNSFPAFTTSSITVTYPVTANLTTSVTNTGTNLITYTYWKDQQTILPVSNPKNADVGGTYYIKGKTAFGCTATQPVIVTILAPPDAKVIAPTAFSPNGDGINDVFKLGVTGEVTVKDVKIYTRWGQLVFITSDINNYWDGRFKGEILPVGIYYWIVEGTDRYKNAKMVNSGSITILK